MILWIQKNSEGRLLSHQMSYYLVLFCTVCSPGTSVDSPGTWGKEEQKYQLQNAVKLCAENGAGGSRESMRS